MPTSLDAAATAVRSAGAYARYATTLFSRPGYRQKAHMQIACYSKRSDPKTAMLTIVLVNARTHTSHFVSSEHVAIVTTVPLAATSSASNQAMQPRRISNSATGLASRLRVSA